MLMKKKDPIVGENISPEKPLSHWISYLEEQPEQSGRYLVNDIVFGVGISGYNAEEDLWDSDYLVYNLVVSHWQPLPQPVPKEDLQPPYQPKPDLGYGHEEWKPPEDKE